MAQTAPMLFSRSRTPCSDSWSSLLRKHSLHSGALGHALPMIVDFRETGRINSVGLHKHHRGRRQHLCSGLQSLNSRGVPESTCEAVRYDERQRLLRATEGALCGGGVDPLTATALVAAVGNAALQEWTELGLYLGLVPRQHSSRVKTVLPGIT